MSEVVQVNQLQKVFRKDQVIKEVSFVVNEGEVFGFLGRNGAGKSTTINMLTGITHPSEGNFKILNMSHTDIDKIKKNIDVMPDAANYYPDLSPLQHLKFFAKIKKIKITNAKLYDILATVGLSGAEKKKVRKFSFGMKKKLGVAQAIIGEPPLLFLDEPTSGLDAQSVIEIQNLIQRLAAKGTTIFMTSHNLAEVEKLCSRIAILKDGVITEYGSIETIRQQFQRSIRLKVTTQLINETLKEHLELALSPRCNELHIQTDGVDCTVHSQEDIPEVIFTLAEQKVDMYEFVTDKVSLEEIFMDDGELYKDV